MTTIEGHEVVGTDWLCGRDDCRFPQRHGLHRPEFRGVVVERLRTHELVVCAHADWRADVDVNRLVSEHEPTALVGVRVDVRVVCIDCGESLRFRVPRMGVLSNDATVSLDGTELHAPAWIGDDALGADLPGFTVRVLRDGEKIDDSGRNYEEPFPT